MRHVELALKRHGPYESTNEFSIEAGRYRIRTAQGIDDLLKAFRLRSEVFGAEFGAGAPQGIWDVDPVLDWRADHLLLEEKASGKLLGTYRILQGHFPPDFYSSSEFEIQTFLEQPGKKIELSRACTHPDARGGTAMVLLWRGLGRYIQLSQADWLFGCSSLPSQEPEQVVAVMQALSPHYDSSLSVRARRECRLPASWLAAEPAENPLPVPSLLSSYLRIGARLASEPAHDPEFRCVDFFTALQLRELESSAQRFL
jgi:putative hemolysin